MNENPKLRAALERIDDDPTLSSTEKDALKRSIRDALKDSGKPRMTGKSSENQADCVKAGGQWGTWGMSPDMACNLPTPDAGKSCTSSSDCIMQCVAEGSEPKPAGVPAVGRCFGWTRMGGFSGDTVEDGKIHSNLTVD